MKEDWQEKIGLIELMQLLQELHKEGYQKLRWYSYFAPNGLHLRCIITSDDNFLYGKYLNIQELNEDKAWWTSLDQETSGVDIKPLLGKFKEELKGFLDKGKGEDEEYVRWFNDLVEAVRKKKVPVFQEIYKDLPPNMILVGNDFISLPNSLIEANCITVPVIGISRFRFGTDGEGITTLVAFQGCPMRCKYCLNKECWEEESKFKKYTPEELYEAVKKDNLYFRATRGGITFGGGEPALRADFIVAFKRLCPRDWKIRIETTLNVDRELIKKLAPVVDEWIVDIKSDRSVAYKNYTGIYRQRFHDNLYYLISKEKGLKVDVDKIILKIPIIPGYVSEEQAVASAKEWRNGVIKWKVKLARYLANEELNRRAKERTEPDGKKICEILKAIREEIMNDYTIGIDSQECTHEGNCPGTCPKCEWEVKELEKALKELDINNIEVSDRLKDLINRNSSSDNLPEIPNEEEWRLQGEEVRLDHKDAFEVDISFNPQPIIEGNIDFRGDVKDIYPQFYQYKKIPFKECAIAGVSFHIKYDDELWQELELGMNLALVRQKNNKHDPNAIAVALECDYDGDPDDLDPDFIIGYVPRTENKDLATMMDAGYANKFSAVISTFNPYAPINDRLRVTIFLQSNEKVLIRPDLLRAQSISEDGLQAMQDELQEKGFTHFRFGGFPPLEMILPEEGEKIVFICEKEDYWVLYLTYVLAAGDECLHYLPEDIFEWVDDCSPYVMTNIIGPVQASSKDYPFLEGIKARHFSGNDYLDNKTSDSFGQIFNSKKCENGRK